MVAEQAGGYVDDSQEALDRVSALVAAEAYKLAESAPSEKRAPRDDSGTVGKAKRAEDGESDPCFRGERDAFFRCSYGSLGGHAHVSASPAALETKTTRTSATTPDLSFTAWDALTFDARDGVTLAGFLDRFRDTVGLEPSTVAHGPALLFADFMNLTKPETIARMNTPLAELLADADADGEIKPTRVGVSVTACDDEDEDVDVPEVWIRIR